MSRLFTEKEELTAEGRELFEECASMAETILKKYRDYSTIEVSHIFGSAMDLQAAIARLKRDCDPDPIEIKSPM